MTSGTNANSPPFERDEIAVVQLTPAATLGLTIDIHVSVDDDLLGVAAGVEETGELEELPEADDLAPDGHVVDLVSVRHS